MKKLISTRQGRWNRALGHVTLGTKIFKNLPNIFHKTALKSMPHFWSILDPTWLHFGMLLGSKLWPSWLRMSPKIDLKFDPKNDHICDRSWDRFWEDFGPQLGGPGGSNEPAVRHLFRSWCPLGAEMSPRPPQEPPGDDFLRFWNEFWLIFERFFIDFWSIFGCFFCKISHQFPTRCCITFCIYVCICIYAHVHTCI